MRESELRIRRKFSAMDLASRVVVKRAKLLRRRPHHGLDPFHLDRSSPLVLPLPDGRGSAARYHACARRVFALARLSHRLLTARETYLDRRRRQRLPRPLAQLPDADRDHYSWSNDA